MKDYDYFRARSLASEIVKESADRLIDAITDELVRARGIDQECDDELAFILSTILDSIITTGIEQEL